LKDTDTIFDLIRKVQTRTEPFHSRLLAWFLKCDPKFREAFLKAFVPSDFLVDSGVFDGSKEREAPTVRAEYPFETRERLDVHLQYSHAVIGVEVKVVDGSATPEQLDSYWKNLVESVPEKSKFMIYLTPFNEANAPPTMDGQTVRLRAVSAFENSLLVDYGTHVNWNEVVCLYPSATKSPFRELYDQHRDYIERFVCDIEQFNKTREALELSIFFGEETVKSFFKEMDNQGVSYDNEEKAIIIPLVENYDKAERVIEALRLFIESDRLKKGRRPQKRVKVPNEVLDGYTHGDFGRFYSQLFQYFESIPYLWLEGSGRIGVRVPHKSYSSFSICTIEEDKLNVLKVRPGKGQRKTEVALKRTDSRDLRMTPDDSEQVDGG